MKSQLEHKQIKKIRPEPPWDQTDGNSPNYSALNHLPPGNGPEVDPTAPLESCKHLRPPNQLIILHFTNKENET